MTAYRAQFKPSVSLKEPLAILAVHVVCADSDAEAERLATSVDLNFARRRQGQFGPIPSPEEAAAYSYSPTDRALIGQNRARLVVGGKAKVMAHVEPLIKATQADELMVTTMIYDHAARRHCYELLAEAFELAVLAPQPEPAKQGVPS
jgi:alkanesulfonate monooxygenase SsuD/methylene tetrahydromethanopterin reductase-like flavin-dependent oxidoreductase (luciferase family)